MADRIRITGPNKPYNITVKNYADVTLFNASTSDEEFNLPDLPGGTILQITNSNNETKTIKRDPTTRTLLRKYHVGPSVSNGDFVNHKNMLDIAIPKGYTYVGVIYGQSDAEDDAALNALDASGPYDHTVPPPGGVYQKGFDEVVRKAYLSNPTDLSKRTTLRVGLMLGRENNRLNNGTTRTLFYDESALNKRPNGELTYKVVDSPVPSIMIPSYASTDFTTFSRRFLLKFMKRYLPAINDGTIMSIGLLTGTTGESEYSTDTRETDGSNAGYNFGDFHPEMVAGFKAKFPQFAGESNNNIANNDLTNSALGRAWNWWLTDVLRAFEWDKIEYIKANLPGLTREQWFQIDCGSMTDALSPRRRTFNAYARIHPATIMVKVNDNTGYGINRNKFMCEHLTSLARKYGGIAIIEPSPQNGRFDEAGGNRPQIAEMLNICREFGVGISFFTQEPQYQDWMTQVGGLQTPVIPAYKNEFRTIGTTKTLNRVDYNLSDIFAVNNVNGMQTAYENYLTQTGASRADLRIIDNVAP